MKKNKKKIIIILFAISLTLLLIGVTYGRYIYNSINERYLLTKKFYFNSDKLDINHPIYQIDNWSAASQYVIEIDLNSYLNNYEVAPYDIEYTLLATCSTNILCNLSQESGIIRAANNHDKIYAYINPNGTLNDGDSAFIEVKATATSPYKKEISARFILNVGKIGLTHTIDDSVNSPYLNFNITNTIDYYLVEEAFLEYQVGNRIDIDTYLLLSDENKDKCTSSLITLTFDPSVVVLDMTSPAYLKRVSETYTTINGYSYVNGISFKIDAIDSEVVKFYKTDTSRDYTYPIVNNNSIVTFSYR